jgi:hypothetical protein
MIDFCGTRGLLECESGCDLLRIEREAYTATAVVAQASSILVERQRSTDEVHIPFVDSMLHPNATLSYTSS